MFEITANELNLFVKYCEIIQTSFQIDNLLVYFQITVMEALIYGLLSDLSLALFCLQELLVPDCLYITYITGT